MRASKIRQILLVATVAASTALLLFAIGASMETGRADALASRAEHGQPAPGMASSDDGSMRLPDATPSREPAVEIDSPLISDRVAFNAKVEAWYRATPPRKAIARLEELKETLEAIKRSELTAMHLRGDGVPIEASQMWEMWDPDMLQSARIAPDYEGGGATFAVLPPEKYPEAYAMHYEQLWLEQRLKDDGLWVDHYERAAELQAKMEERRREVMEFRSR